MLLTEQQQDTLKFMDELCQEASDAARAGDLSLANALGRTGGAQFYFTNVHKLHSVTPEFFAANYPRFMTEVTRLREAYLKDQQQEDRITTLEAKLDEALGLIETLREEQSPSEPAPAKRGRKAKAKVQEAVTDDTGEDEPDDEAHEDHDEAD